MGSSVENDESKRMFGGGRRAVAVLVTLALAASPVTAHAQGACDAGAGCVDQDGDGFVACACAAAGTPCDCDDTDPTRYPRAPEACNAPSDRDCTGAVEACPRGKGCLDGTCVPECIPRDDFGCVVGSSFDRQPSGVCLCRPQDCTVFGCPPGSVCDDAKRCIPSCNDDVRCPAGQRCRSGACVDPCTEVTCPAGAACAGGICVTSCSCCPAGEACDPASPAPRCIDAACVSVRCAAGSHCERGTCLDDCEGVVCPPMRVCRKVSVNGAPGAGACVDLCAPDPCKPGFVCQWRDGSCTPRPIAAGGLTGGPTAADDLEIQGAGLFCTTTIAARGSALFAGSVLVGLALLTIRRRRVGGY